VKSIIDLLKKDKQIMGYGMGVGPLNQSAAARLFGIGQPTINRWMMGTSGISLEFKLKILIHYNEPPQEYLTGPEMDYVHILKRYLNSHLQ